MSNPAFMARLAKLFRATTYGSIVFAGSFVAVSSWSTVSYSQEIVKPNGVASLFDAPEIQKEPAQAVPAAQEFAVQPQLKQASSNQLVEPKVIVPFNHSYGLPQRPVNQMLNGPAQPAVDSLKIDEATELRPLGFVRNDRQVQQASSTASDDTGHATTAAWNSNAGSNVRFAAPGSVAAEPVPAPAMKPVYQLTNTTWQSFEQRLVNTWKARLRVATSQDGRLARVMVPDRTDTEYMPLLIDRAKNTVTFEGTQAQSSNWNRLIGSLDRSSRDGNVRVFAIENETPQRVAQVAYLMGLQDARVPTPSAQDQGDGNSITRQIPFDPSMLQNREPSLLTQGQDAGVTGQVKIEIIAELGVIVLSGAPDDVARVEQTIQEILKQSAATESQPQRILLENQLSSKIVEEIQELYDEEYAETKGPATIRAVDTPNSLIVIAQDDSHRLIKEIVSLYDSKSETPEDGIETYRLKYISALDAKARVDALLGQTNFNSGDPENLPPALSAISVADVRSNSLTVRANGFIQNKVAELIRAIDVDKTDDGAVNVVKIIPLKNSLATEMQAIVQDILAGQLQNAGQGFNPDPQNTGGGNQGNTNQFDAQGNSSTLRAAMLELLEDPEFGPRVRSSITFDIRVGVNQASNALVVTGPESSMEFVNELVRRLDRIPDAETQIKVFRIQHGDATLLLETLESMFVGTAQGAGNQGGGTQNTRELPLQSDTSVDGQSLTNLRFSLDERTNSIIASGSVGDLMIVDALIQNLDVVRTDGRQTRVYRLSNLFAEDMATAINDWLDRREEFVADDPTYNSPITQARRLVSVTPVAVGNSLIVSAVPTYTAEIEALIRELDRRPPLVKVKVLLAEIDLSTLEEIGVDVGIQNSLLFDRGAANDINFNFNQATVGNDAVGRGTLAGQVLSNLGTGRTNSTLGYGGLVLSAGNESVSVLLRALQDKRCLKVLNKPHVMTLENLQGRIFVGGAVPRVTGSSQTFNGAIQNTVSDEEVGLILGITPRVSPDGMIVLFVDAQNSALGDEADGVAIAVSQTGEVIRSPQINRTQIQTTIQARSGQTVVISGLIQESKTHFERGAPILSDLPVIGPLFKFEGDSAERSELLVILTPYLVENDGDIVMQNQDEIDRMHWCECDVAGIYGNTEYNGGPIKTNRNTEVFYPDMDPMGAQPQTVGSDSLETARPINPAANAPGRPAYEGGY